MLDLCHGLDQPVLVDESVVAQRLCREASDLKVAPLDSFVCTVLTISASREQGTTVTRRMGVEE